MRPKPLFASVTRWPIGCDMKPTASPLGTRSIRNWHCCKTAANEIVDEHAAAKDTLAEIEQAWQAAWHPAGIAPDTPEVMQAWLIRWQRFTEQVAVWNRHSAEVSGRRATDHQP